jgi:pyrimidine 5'-nucleotidase
MTVSTLFFDLDDTLYPASCGLWRDIRGRIDLYMHERLGIPAEKVVPLRRYYYEKYGTALRGLEREYPLDKADFLAFVHDLPLHQYLAPNPGLRRALENTPGRKFIFTNADRPHAMRVLQTLGLQDCFEGIIDVLAVTPYCKPMPESFEIALRLAGSPAPEACILFDDMTRTTLAAQKAGFFTVLVSEIGLKTSEADAVLQSWDDLPDILSQARARRMNAP